ncbi:angio-associated migratory cell protein-like isoform X2 [Gordionus sp. m RMFG-2023]|uniref:angio-associated migratory cell protein-like isoform X2 n=1 Tax=Gordionus sp. m RMFG-2023 TaxID=3053472 RepID=UPI0031FC3E34
MESANSHSSSDEDENMIDLKDCEEIIELNDEDKDADVCSLEENLDDINIEKNLTSDNEILFQNHTKPIFSIDLYMEKHLIVTGGEDDMAYIWEFSFDNQHNPYIPITGHTDSVIFAKFDSSHLYLATVDMSGKIIVYLLEHIIKSFLNESILCKTDNNCKLTHHLNSIEGDGISQMLGTDQKMNDEATEETYNGYFSRKNPRFKANKPLKPVYTHDLETDITWVQWGTSPEPRSHPKLIIGTEFGPVHSLDLSFHLSKDKGVKGKDLDQELLHEQIFADGRLARASACRCLPDSNSDTFVVGYSDGALKIWGPSNYSLSLFPTYSHSSKPIQPKSDAKSSHIPRPEITCIEVYLPPIKNNRLLQNPNMSGILPDYYVISGDADGGMELHNGADGKHLGSFNMVDNHVTQDQLLSVETLSIATNTGHSTEQSGVTKAQWLSEEPNLAHIIISAHLEGYIYLWDSRTGASLKQFRPHDLDILDFVVSSDGKYIATCSEDARAKLIALEL